MSAHDLVVIGAGPAGLAAAIEARKRGLDVAVVDEQPEPGGQIYRAIERNVAQGRAAALGEEYVAGAGLVSEFRASGATYLSGHQAWQLEADGRVYVSDGAASRCLTGRRVLLAVGAMERPVPIRGWTLPGVMTVGAAQILQKTAAMLPGEDVWIAGSGPLALYYAAHVLAAGGRIAGLLDTSRAANRRAALVHWRGALSGWRYLAQGWNLLRTIDRARLRIAGVEEVQALGEARLEAVRWRVGSRWSEARASTLLLHEGLVPNLQMTLALGCEHDWHPLQHAFRPRVDRFGATTQEAIYVAGDCGGIAGARVARLRGQLAALAVATDCGRLPAERRDHEAEGVEEEMREHLAVRPFLDALYVPRADVLDPPDEVIACRCEAVTAQRIREAVKLGCLGPNQAKSFTRSGMGPCQGRLCGPTVNGIIASARGVDPAQVGLYRVRPPLKPLRLGELAALAEEAGAE